MTYLTFEPTVYDYPESDRTDRNHQPEYRIPGEDDLWADHSQSCKYAERERDGKTELVLILDQRTEQPLDHSDLDSSPAMHEAATIARVSSDTDLSEETTRTETSDPPSIYTPTMRRALFIAATPTPAVMRVEALRRMYRRTKSDENRAFIARIAENIKLATPAYAGQERYAELLAAKERQA